MNHDLQKLLTWLSPAFPVGAFAWSAGLETAIVSGAVQDRASAQGWIAGNLAHGGIRTDAILLAHAHRAAGDAHALRDLADLCLALTPARERHDETLGMGEAFVAAAHAWPSAAYDALPRPCPYSIAIGAIAASHNIALDAVLTAFLTAVVQGQVSVAVRLVPIGQSDGLAIVAALEQAVSVAAMQCQSLALDAIGAVAYATDIAQMAHETLPTRIFRS
ncbi:urease accessory protein UreF [Devosia ginsengisoli]|uniref:urease accessory protein UreF n=1 Tax=Devosia ginsengisoli TaxID=400770 RepID=UPI0026F3178B|nr:urease accessory UreF family protein [Devosia ginsengisoli]MCR6672871.1 urease accessory protein UreF [Devosia ginsengisoli]MCR6673997.1 urease accessory protein UreF [Devosia ginsengisoli]